MSAIISHEETKATRLTGDTFAIWKCPHATATAEVAIDETKAVIDGSGLVVA